VRGLEFEKWKPWLFAGVFVPPLALSTSNPEIFYSALDYGGAFGVSTLFLVLPPIMVWKSRYVLEGSGLMTKPMVPLGKIPLVFMLAAAGALIIQQVEEKFEVSNFFQTF
jgi:tyrosine-specific transport protein